MSKEEWLRLPYLVRLWRLLTCNHIQYHHKNRKIGTVNDVNYTKEILQRGDIPKGWKMVIHIKQCSHCNQYYLDSGVEDS
jgi:hypothetical protein